jgi:hypothetical protein
LGIIPLALCALAISKAGRHRVWLLWGLSGFCFLLALGDRGVLYQGLRWAFPQIGLARYPIKFLLLPAFALPLLAAYGAQVANKLISSKPSRYTRRCGPVILIMLLGIAIPLGLTSWRPTPYDQWPVVWHSAVWRALFLLIAFTLFSLRRPDATPLQRYLAGLGLLASIVADARIGTPQTSPILPSSVLTTELGAEVRPPKLGEGRVMISPEAEVQLVNSRVPNMQNDFIGKRLALFSHLNLLERAPKVNGSSTLQIREQHEIQKLLYRSAVTNAKPLVDFLGVSAMTTPGKVVEWTRRDSFLPLITAGQQPAFAAPSEITNAITLPSFDPGQTVYLPTEASRLITVTNRVETTIRNPVFGTHRLDCDVETSAPTLLVIAQTFYDPWHAYVDGKRTRLWRANHAFQSLEIPAGQHHVQVRYEDRSFRIGSMISLLTLVGCLAFYAGPKWQGAVCVRCTDAKPVTA